MNNLPRFANAEEMIAKWLEFCNLWFDATETPLDRSYITDFDTESLHHGDHMFVSVHLDLDDELREANLLGVYEDGVLEYLTAEVDTDWRDVWARNAGFLNKPS